MDVTLKPDGLTDTVSTCLHVTCVCAPTLDRHEPQNLESKQYSPSQVELASLPKAPLHCPASPARSILIAQYCSAVSIAWQLAMDLRSGTRFDEVA